MTHSTTELFYYANFTSAIGTLNSFSENEKGMECKFTLISGRSDKPNKNEAIFYVYKDELKKLIRRCQDALTEKSKIVISFRFKNGYASNSVMKGTLYYVSSIKVNNMTKYENLIQPITHDIDNIEFQSSTTAMKASPNKSTQWQSKQRPPKTNRYNAQSSHI